ncbi:hypothetical protein NPIL_192631, partial [Nephila pilipes]
MLSFNFPYVFYIVFMVAIVVLLSNVDISDAGSGVI